MNIEEVTIHTLQTKNTKGAKGPIKRVGYITYEDKEHITISTVMREGLPVEKQIIPKTRVFSRRIIGAVVYIDEAASIPQEVIDSLKKKA